MANHLKLGTYRDMLLSSQVLILKLVPVADDKYLQVLQSKHFTNNGYQHFTELKYYTVFGTVLISKSTPRLKNIYYVEPREIRWLGKAITLCEESEEKLFIYD